MKTSLVIKLIFLITFTSCQSENECNLEGDVTVEKKLDDKRILTISPIGIKQCSRECSSISGCLSFNYERSSLTCVLNYADQNTETLATDSNVEYHEAQTNKFIGDCNSTICGIFSRCVNINSYGPFCIPRFCPQPPQTIQQGNLVPNGDNAVGKDRTYTCNTGYILVGSPNITCQSDGTWSAFQLCKDCGQPPAVTGANVNPGSTLIGSTRTYTCLLEHHTEGSTSIYCQSNAIWSTSTLYCRPYRWPLGTYGLYKASGGCPTAGASWSEGSIKQDVEDSNPATSFTPSLSSYMSGVFTINDITHHFCMRGTATQTGDELQWPPGSYCILQKYNCPSGFSSGYIFWDDEDNANYNTYIGDLPEYARQYSEDTKLGYCCRSDGSASNPIKLPTNMPFYLLKSTIICQQVDRMNVVEHFISYDCEDTNPTSYASGSYPYVVQTINWYLQFCYYYK